MGLAASQCRLLLLTARLSDTEYRAQMISQRRMALAMQTEQIATDYNRALNNRVLKHVFDLEGKSGTAFKEPLSYATLTAQNNYMGGGLFRCKDTQGRIIVPSPSHIPGIIVHTNNEGVNSAHQVRLEDIKNFCLAELGNNENIKNLAAENWTDEEYSTAWQIINSDTSLKNKFYNNYANEENKVVVQENVTIIGGDNQAYVVLPAIDNTDFFQNCIRTGTIQIEQYQKNYAENNGWASFNPLSSQFITDDLDTSDDAAAQATYESKSALIKAQDQMLELELRQVETQHQAAQTEYDSVKKVIDKNIERSFKTFG